MDPEISHLRAGHPMPHIKIGTSPKKWRGTLNRANPSSCHSRLNKFTEAGSLFERMLWLNPTDNQGARFLFDEVRAKKPWESDCLKASHE